MSSLNNEERRIVADAVHLLGCVADKIEAPNGSTVLDVIKMLRSVADGSPGTDAASVNRPPAGDPVANGGRITSYELLRRGGEWLGAAREWVKWHKRNGDRVTWGSGDELQPPMTIREVEELAAEVAATLWTTGGPPSVMTAARVLTNWHYGSAQAVCRDGVIVPLEEWDALRRAVQEAPKEARATIAADGGEGPHRHPPENDHAASAVEALDATAEAMRECAYAFARTVLVDGGLYTMHLAPPTPSSHDDGPWTWSCVCEVPRALPFIGVEYANPEDGWRAVDEWERFESSSAPARSTEGDRAAGAIEAAEPSDPVSSRCTCPSNLPDDCTGMPTHLQGCPKLSGTSSAASGR